MEWEIEQGKHYERKTQASSHPFSLPCLAAHPRCDPPLPWCPHSSVSCCSTNQSPCQLSCSVPCQARCPRPKGCDLSRKLIWKVKSGSCFSVFGTARGLGCPVRGLRCSYGMSSQVTAWAGQKEIVILLRFHAPSVRTQWSFSYGSDRSAVEVIQAPRLPSAHLNFLAAGTRGQCRLGYGQGVPGKGNWQERGQCPR